MAVSVPFTQHDLENVFSMVNIKKGKQLVDQQLVASLKVEKNNVVISISARVRDKDRNFYNVRVIFDNEKSHQSFENSCTCHMRNGCEHVTAALIASIDPPNLQSLVPLDYQPNYQLTKWLNDLTKSSDVSDDMTDIQEPLLPSVLVVIVNGNSDSGIKLKFHRIPLTAKGVYSKTRRLEFAVGDVFSDDRLTFSPQEWSLLLKIGQYFPKKYGSIAFLRGSSFPADVLQEMIEVGHCYWQGIEGARLSWGEPISGRLSWSLNDSGSQELSCQVEESVDTIILSMPLLYMRQREGIIGLIKTEVPDKLLQSMLKAPAISQRDANYIRETVDADPSLLSIPKPLSIEVITVQRVLPQPKLVVSSHNEYFTHKKQLTARLSFLYQGVEVPCDRYRNTETQKSHKGKLYKIFRDIKAEEATERHMRGKLEWQADYSDPGLYCLPVFSDIAVEEVAQEFHDNVAPDLRKKGWLVEFDPDFPYLPIENLGEWYANIESSSGLDWFDLDMGVMIGDQKFNILPLIVQLLRNGFKETIDRLSKEGESSVIHIKLENGRTLPLPAHRLKKITDTLLELYDTAPLTSEGTLRLSKWQVALVAEVSAATIATELRWIGPDD
ncbi:MAG: hypothetical protein WCG04_04690, partial [Alphaproteobacteria bacterium]